MIPRLNYGKPRKQDYSILNRLETVLKADDAQLGENLSSCLEPD